MDVMQVTCGGNKWTDLQRESRVSAAKHGENAPPRPFFEHHLAILSEPRRRLAGSVSG
jgi:hypothetical protein